MTNKTQGINAEEAFIQLIKRIKPNAIITKSSPDEDMHQHFDYIINDKKIDVKSIKECRLNSTNYTIIELINVNMDKGWLYGAADLIAFQSGNSNNYQWLLVDRIELIEFCKKNIKMQVVDTLNQAVNKLYSRGNDLISVVDMDLLKNLNQSKIIKNKY